jgi:DNA-binding NarL/FixJ family response regulator
MIRVLIVEEYEGMRQGLFDLLRDLPYVGAIDIAEDLVEASRLLRRANYDVVVLGLEDTDRSGLGVIQAFRQISPLTSVLLLGLSIDTRLAMWPIRFGVMGYIPKEVIAKNCPPHCRKPPPASPTCRACITSQRRQGGWLFPKS